MGKVRDEERLEMIYLFVEANPGCSQLHIARGLGLCRPNVGGYLASMESVGLYLSEDNEGRLYPFSKERVCNE